MKHLAILGVRLLALYMLLLALISMEFIPAVLLDEHFDFTMGWHSFVVSGGYLILSVALFFGSERIATFMMPKSEEEGLQVDNYQKLSAVVFSAMGLFIIYLSIQSLFQSLASIVNMDVMYPDNPDMQEYQILTLVFGGLIQLIVGVLLFIGGKTLAKWWYGFRNWT